MDGNIPFQTLKTLLLPPQVFIKVCKMDIFKSEYNWTHILLKLLGVFLISVSVKFTLSVTKPDCTKSLHL